MKPSNTPKPKLSLPAFLNFAEGAAFGVALLSLLSILLIGARAAERASGQSEFTMQVRSVELTVMQGASSATGEAGAEVLPVARDERVAMQSY